MKVWLEPPFTFRFPDGEMAPFTPAEAVIVYWFLFCVKTAVTTLFSFIVTVAGLVVPDASPIQPVKDQPAAGVAVICT